MLDPLRDSDGMSMAHPQHPRTLAPELGDRLHPQPVAAQCLPYTRSICLLSAAKAGEPQSGKWPDAFLCCRVYRPAACFAC